MAGPPFARNAAKRSEHEFGRASHARSEASTCGLTPPLPTGAPTLHLVTVTEEPDRNPIEDYKALRRELELYNAELSNRAEIVALSKGDLPVVYEAYPELKERFAEIGVELHLVSSAAHQGLDTLMQRVAREIFVE